MRSFVPLLVHRYARARLRTGAATADPRHDVAPARSTDVAAAEASGP